MQEELRTDEVEKDKLHTKMKPIINTMDEGLSAKDFCENLRDRAGLIADYGENAYIFRHKSFREYLAALKLVDEAKRDQKRLKNVVQSFGDDWWEEPLRFFINEADDKLFNEFMDALFASDVSKELDQKQQNLLRTMVCEAAQVRIDSLIRRLNDGRVTDTKKRYILDCLKVIDQQEARNAISDFAAKEALTSAAGSHAQEIAFEMGLEAFVEISVREAEAVSVRELVKVEIVDKPPQSFHNRYEYNAEYIIIPGGRYKYQGKAETNVPSVYFAKYPVTNKRYRRFIRYLQDKEPNLTGVLPKPEFDNRMTTLISKIEGLSDYMGNSPDGWPEKLRSTYDTEKRFDGEDQPVMGVSWFDVRAYCCWLSLLETTHSDLPFNNVVNLYRLPREIEWEWASSGGKREYPWSPEKGPPTDKLANYNRNVGATTPVGRYPDGATPEGLMDMAGNVWEWMQNWQEECEGKYRSLRGSSWHNLVSILRCSGPHYVPDLRDYDVGFRVVRSQS